MLALNDFPALLQIPSCVTVHGIGKGGGELVARKLSHVFKMSDSQLLAFSSGWESVLKGVFHNRKYGHVLCTAGPRDIAVLLTSALMFRRADVYLQVPYHRSITWRDPVHLIVVLLYIALVTLLARGIFVNSADTGRCILFRQTVTILPVYRKELDAAQSLKPIIKILNSQAPRIFNVVCRLNIERGRGSRDIEGLRRFVCEVANWNLSGGFPTVINHYGECEPEIEAMLVKHASGAIRFQGYVADWIHRSKGPLVLFSLYEGFGLAAFEAALAGRQVYVNEAFPPELLVAAPNIHRFFSSVQCGNILSQFDAYC